MIAAVVMLAMAGTIEVAAQAAGTSPKKAAATQGTAERRVKLAELSPAVRATVEAETRGATLKGLTQETADGKVVYEVETVVNGRTRDLMIDSAGKVYDVEEQIGLEKVPAPVRAAIEAKGQILVLEAATTNGRVHYEGQVRTKAGRKLSFDLDPQGKPIVK
jgi:uncharacterized membrane protein YkoI